MYPVLRIHPRQSETDGEKYNKKSELSNIKPKRRSHKYPKRKKTTVKSSKSANKTESDAKDIYGLDKEWDVEGEDIDSVIKDSVIRKIPL